MKLTIRVTKTDIRKGESHDCDSCPVALATNRALAQAGVRSIATVGSETISFYRLRKNGKKGVRRVATVFNPRVEAFVDNFDGGGDVKPFQTTIKLPTKVAAL